LTKATYGSRPSANEDGQITERKAGASPLDRVRVEVELTIDCNGNYGARASVIDAPPTAPHSAVILRKRYTLTAPHPDTYTRPSEAPSDRVSVLRMGEKRSGIEDVIDGDYQVIT